VSASVAHTLDARPEPRGSPPPLLHSAFGECRTPLGWITVTVRPGRALWDPNGPEPRPVRLDAVVVQDAGGEDEVLLSQHLLAAAGLVPDHNTPPGTTTWRAAPELEWPPLVAQHFRIPGGVGAAAAALRDGPTAATVARPPQPVPADRHHRHRAPDPDPTARVDLTVSDKLEALHDKRAAEFGDMCKSTATQASTCFDDIFSDRLVALVQRFRSVWVDADGPARTEPVPIHLRGRPEPVVRRPYPVPQAQQAQVEETLAIWRATGRIEPAAADAWGSPSFCVPKAGGKVRLVTNLVELNRHVRPLAHPAATVEQILLAIPPDTQVLGSVDLEEAYGQLPLQRDARPLTGFTVAPNHHYQYRSMPFGLSTAVALFTRALSRELVHLRPYVLVFLDDILVLGRSRSHFLHVLEQLMQVLQRANWRASARKTVLGVRSLPALGRIITTHGTEAAPADIAGIAALPEPRTVADLRALLGAMGYLHRHVPHLHKASVPLFALLQQRKSKRRDRTRLLWTPGHAAALAECKRRLRGAVRLAHVRPEWRLVLFCDAATGGAAGAGGLGAYLAQRGPNGQEEPLRLLFRRLRPPERHLHIAQLETAAIHFGLTSCAEIVRFRDVLVLTDSQAAASPARSPSTKRELRLQAEIMDFAPVIRRIGTYENAVANLLSRAAAERPPPVQTHLAAATVQLEQQTRPPTPPSAAAWRRLQGEDPDLQHLLEPLRGAPAGRTVREGRHTYALDDDGILVLLLGEHSSRRTLRAVPGSGTLREDILRRYHTLTCHAGPEKLRRTTREQFFWPGLRLDTQTFCASCPICTTTKGRTRPTGDLAGLVARFPADLVAVDVYAFKTDVLILTSLCLFSGWMAAQRIPDKQATTTLSAFRRLWAPHMGTPARVLADRAFRAAPWTAWAEQNDVELLFAPAYSPRSNGRLERAHGSLTSALRALEATCPGDTSPEDLLDAALQAHNLMPDAVTATSPFVVVYGRPPHRLHVPGTHNRTVAGDDTYAGPGTTAFTRAVRRLHRQVHEARLQHAISSSAASNMTRAWWCPSPGTLVYRLTKPRSAKAAPRFTGPWRVVRMITPARAAVRAPGERATRTVEVPTDQLRPLQLSKFFSQADHELHAAQRASRKADSRRTKASSSIQLGGKRSKQRPPADLAEEDSEDEDPTTWEVERVLDHRIHPKSGALQFLISWKHFDTSADSWEPTVNLDGCTTAIFEYLTRWSEKQPKRSPTTEVDSDKHKTSVLPKSKAHLPSSRAQRHSKRRRR